MPREGAGGMAALVRISGGMAAALLLYASATPVISFRYRRSAAAMPPL
ncbi:MAG TPA: hypothetical protein VJ901_16865 [Thermoanaerobaculia bacterium]|nr:hypothetical protein [Thermoanaerobaculia bacterium]